MENKKIQVRPAYTSDYRFIKADNDKKFVLSLDRSFDPEPDLEPYELSIQDALNLLSHKVTLNSVYHPYYNE